MQKSLRFLGIIKKLPSSYAQSWVWHICTFYLLAGSMEFVRVTGRQSRGTEREGQTEGVSNWKSGGFCLWAGCNQIWKQTIQLFFYHQRGTLHSLLITEWMSKSGFRERFDCDVSIKSLRRLSLCPSICHVALETLLWNKVERILTAPSEGLSPSSSSIPALYTLCSFCDGWDQSKVCAVWRLRWNEDPSSNPQWGQSAGLKFEVQRPQTSAARDNASIGERGDFGCVLRI